MIGDVNSVWKKPEATKNTVWGCVSYSGVSELTLIDAIVRSEVYKAFLDVNLQKSVKKLLKQ